MRTPVPFAAIRGAAARLRGRIHRTPVAPSRTLGDRAGVRLLLKCESFQKTGSFKPRGALNIVLGLDDAARSGGLVTASAGNHAQAVAWAARDAGVPCTVVMPSRAPRSKLDATRGYGATVVLHDDLATIFDRTHEERERLGAALVHPFDDPVGLAGAGTVGLEILEDVPDVDVVVVPLGGGGLLGGVACAIKAVRPSVRVVGVELGECPGMAPALAAGAPVPAPRKATLADGLAAPFVGALPFEVAKTCVDAVVGVTEAEIVAAMALLFTRAKLYVEGAGAAATAAVLAGKTGAPAGSRVVAIVSGGNVDAERILAAIARQEQEAVP